MRKRRNATGFTLVEVIVVVAIIATVSSIIIPTLLGSRVSASESTAIATLRTICTAENTYRQQAAADRNSNGEGEYGYLAEMASLVPPAGAAQVLTPSILPNSFRLVSNGFVDRVGYLYRVILPGPNGAPAPEAATGGEDAGSPVDPALAEAIWVAYCWPAVRGTTGFRVFVINQRGDILHSDNVVQGYSGYATPVPPDAAFTVANNVASPIAVNARGNDGALWKAVK
jgi:prepilin-type N-terminal cleavage/methylation domain-containing protein